jgi:hypothetical protein
MAAEAGFAVPAMEAVIVPMLPEMGDMVSLH